MRDIYHAAARQEGGTQYMAGVGLFDAAREGRCTLTWWRAIGSVGMEVVREFCTGGMGVGALGRKVSLLVVRCGGIRGREGRRGVFTAE